MVFFIKLINLTASKLVYQFVSYFQDFFLFDCFVFHAISYLNVLANFY